MWVSDFHWFLPWCADARDQPLKLRVVLCGAGTLLVKTFPYDIFSCGSNFLIVMTLHHLSLAFRWRFGFFSTGCTRCMRAKSDRLFWRVLVSMALDSFHFRVWGSFCSTEQQQQREAASYSAFDGFRLFPLPSLGPFLEHAAATAVRSSSSTSHFFVSLSLFEGCFS